jgi:alkyl hydroperoxide reductase subunit D
MSDTATVATIEELRQALPEPAKDLKLNLQAVLRSESLTANQVFGCALASAFYLGDAALRDALLEEARVQNVDDKTVDDARAAAAIMGMNTVYYRFRHMIGKEAYSTRPARLRMNRMMQPATGKLDFELFSMAVAALAGCEMCIRSHEASILKHGGTEDQVHDSVRIAAVLKGVAVARTL